MEIENSFDVPALIDEVWAYLIDVERIAPCLPGASITRAVDDRTYEGAVQVKLGPVALAFRGTAEIEERDADAKRVTIRASGREERGRGAARAVSVLVMAPEGSGTRVRVTTTLQLTGAVAQYGRGSMVVDVSAGLVAQFARCLEENLGAGAS